MGLGMAEEGASSCIGVTSPNLGGSEEEESREHRSPCGQAYRLPGDLDTHHSPTQAPRLVSAAKTRGFHTQLDEGPETP